MFVRFSVGLDCFHEYACVRVCDCVSVCVCVMRENMYCTAYAYTNTKQKYTYFNHI